MKKLFLLNEENKYLQELYIFNKYPNYILPIEKHYKTNEYYIIEYQDYFNFNKKVNKTYLDHFVSFLKILHNEKIYYKYLSSQTVFCDNEIIYFSINNQNFENIVIDNKLFLPIKEYDYDIKNDIYMLGLYIY